MLYKYLPMKRRDILERGMIRFSQPGDFNDPFDLNPRFQLMSKADLARGPQAFQEMLRTLQPGIQRASAETAITDGMYSLNNSKIARSLFDSKFGVLSLSESPNNLLMWAHYADCHRGFVLQLDETHEFFAPRTFDGQELVLSRVEYSDERPDLSYSNVYSPSVYYRKSPAWAYEAEWRIFRPLADAQIVDPHPRYPRALFELPPQAIRGVIIGVAVDHQTRTSMFELLQRPDLKHIIIYQTRLSDENYSLKFDPPLDGGTDPDETTWRVCEAR